MKKLTETKQLNLLKKRVEETKLKEVALNLQLGRKASYQKGSLGILVRWDILEKLLDKS